MSDKERTHKKKWAKGMHPGLMAMSTLLNEEYIQKGGGSDRWVIARGVMGHGLRWSLLETSKMNFLLTTKQMYSIN